MLAGLGLSTEQEDLYAILISHPELSCAQVAALLPDDSAETAGTRLEALVELGMASRLAGSPLRYEAIPPDIVIESLARSRVSDVEHSRQRIPELMETFLSSRAPAAADCIELLTSPDHITQRFDQLHQHATAEIRGFNCGPYLATPHCDDDIEILRLKDGVRFRIIYTPKIFDSPDTWPWIEHAINQGEEARILDTLPGKLIIFDTSSAFISLVSAADRLCMIVVHESPLLDLLSALFEQTWDGAVPLGTGDLGPSRQTADGPDGEERLIRLLAGGAGDEAISRALNVSLSTVQRRVRALMQEYGVRSRFQLGLQIGRRGS